MTASSQHGFHPDAESLSAFSEQVLSERERDEVLAHLAVCGRCRQLVALARQAADAGEETVAALPRKIVAPTAWWKQWRLVWVPTAVVAAFAVTSISIYIERTDRRGSDIKIAEQDPTPDATPPATPTPTEQAKVEPPASAAPATPPTHGAKHEHSTAPEQLPTPAPPVVEAKKPSESRAPAPRAPAAAPGDTDREEFRREAPPMSHRGAMQAPPEFIAGAMHPADSQPGPGAGEAKKKQAEEHSQEETETSRTRSFNAKPTPFGMHGADGAQPASATETAGVAPPVETQPAVPAEPASMLGFKHMRDVSSPANRIQLPSGLASVSIASGGHLLLAIDRAGALFLSEDRGVTWERITAQWTGRAVEVHRQVAATAGMPTAPAAQNGTTDGSSPNAGTASPPPVSFELSNDENQTWVSTDGRTWAPK
jgi:hypothetical protein